MVSVQQADKIVQAHTGDYGAETVSLEEATGRILAENITADRDLPPFNRATMDGVAISHKSYLQGTRSFRIKGVQAAGDPPVEISRPDECIEIMTGCALPESTDTVIPYEDILIQEQQAILQSAVQVNQNVHAKGKDKKRADLLVPSGTRINPAVIAVAASVGKSLLAVKKQPRTLIISTGNELIEVEGTPSPYQIRRSNNYMIRSVLEEYKLFADMIHLPDDQEVIQQQVGTALNAYDVVLLSGGVSMGRFDFVPQALKTLEVKELFHKVEQRPGKPFWFGLQEQTNTLVFGFPGNPVSTFLCLHRYFLPWLKRSLGIPPLPLYAALDGDIRFAPPLQYFIQVKWQINEKGQSVAKPEEGNGSGDFSNLLGAHAFMELPSTQTDFQRGEVFPVWPFTPLS